MSYQDFNKKYGAKANKKYGEKKNKFNAQKTIYNGVEYDSVKEAGFAETLDKLMCATDPAERVVSWKGQVPFKVFGKDGKRIALLTLDFVVEYANGRTAYIDVKGYMKGCEMSYFNLRKRVIENEYGFKVEIV